VIRRPPLGELQPRAHDMAREFRVISALWPTAVSVARPYALCLDTEVTGAVFYVMGHVQGRSGSTDWLATPSERSTASGSFIDSLASLHCLDVDAIGLGDLARREHYVARQLTSWYRSWTSNADATGDDDPRVHELHAWLGEHAPDEGEPRLVHGDYGFHNTIVGDGARVAAVVDWEVCTLGPALSDLAFVLNRWTPEGVPASPEGFWSRDALVARYQARTGIALAQLGYRRAFNAWRSACIQHGCLHAVCARPEGRRRHRHHHVPSGIRRSTDARRVFGRRPAVKGTVTDDGRAVRSVSCRHRGCGTRIPRSRPAPASGPARW
jgi:aminoglycoside phosphotransferase (APT) family kinase protein